MKNSKWIVEIMKLFSKITLKLLKARKNIKKVQMLINKQ